VTGERFEDYCTFPSHEVSGLKLHLSPILIVFWRVVDIGLYSSLYIYMKEFCLTFLSVDRELGIANRLIHHTGVLPLTGRRIAFPRPSSSLQTDFLTAGSSYTANDPRATSEHDLHPEQQSLPSR
jgi:hypothetical protein